MEKYKHQNDEARHMLVTIDCFGKRPSVHPLMDKEGPSVKKALIEVLEELGDSEKTQFGKEPQMRNKTVEDHHQ